MADGTETPVTLKQYSRRNRTPKKFTDFEVEGLNAVKTKKKTEKTSKKSSEEKARYKSTISSAEKKKEKKSEAIQENNANETKGAKSSQGESSSEGFQSISEKESDLLPGDDTAINISNVSELPAVADENKSKAKEVLVGSKKRKGKPRKSLSSLDEAETNEIPDDDRVIASPHEVNKVKEMVDSLRSTRRKKKLTPVIFIAEQTENTIDEVNAVHVSAESEDTAETEKVDTGKLEKESQINEEDKPKVDNLKEKEDNMTLLVGKNRSRRKKSNDNLNKSDIPDTNNDKLVKADKTSEVTDKNEKTPASVQRRNRRKKDNDCLSVSSLEQNELNAFDSPKLDNSISVSTVKATLEKHADTVEIGKSDVEEPNTISGAREATEIMKTPSVNKKRQRKRKGIDNLNDSSLVESPAMTVDQSEVSRSGRKRKKVNYSAMNSEHSDDESEVLKTKRSRKSRTKDHADGDDSFSDEIEETKKQKKKATTTSKKATTTPKKATTTPKKSQEQVKSFSCPKCDFIGQNPESMKKHVAVTHQLLWSKENPEGSSDKRSLGYVIKIRKFLNCPRCDKRLNFMQYYNHHVEWCGHEHETYKCELCGSSNLKAMWQHIHHQQCTKVRADLEAARMKEEALKETQRAENEPLGKKRSAATKALTMLKDISKDGEVGSASDNVCEDPDADIDDKEDTDDDDDDEGDIDEDEEEEGVPVSPDEVEKVTHRARVARPRGQYSKYFMTYDLMKTFVAKNFSNKLYDAWLPRKECWTALPISECERYAPGHKTSVHFTFGKPSDSISLALYESEICSGFPIFYTGLAVWKLAWCPVPYKHKRNQFLAIVGKTDPHDTFYTSQQAIGPGTIQIWDTHISTNAFKQTAKPRLCYTIVHEFGKATSLQWCPSGCYQSPGSREEDADCLRRLGLLAASFTDGTIRIFSLPHPEGSTQLEVHPTYRPVPVISLMPNRRWKQESLVCTCFDWSIAKGHTKIVAGYSDGSVALFHLVSTSPLLLIQTSPGSTLLPYHRFCPFGNLVRSVRFCAPSEKRIAAGSEDFDTIFLDVDNSSVTLMVDPPVNMTVNMTSCLWHHGIFQTCDDNYAIGSNRARYFESSSLNYYSSLSEKEGERKDELLAFNISSQSACVWEVSVSNWLNYAVAADNRGLVCGMALQDMILSYPDVKLYKYRQTLFTTTVQNINTEDVDKFTDTIAVVEKDSKSSDTSVVLAKDKGESVCENQSAKCETEMSQGKNEIDNSSVTVQNVPNVSSDEVKHNKAPNNLLEHSASVTGEGDEKDSKTGDQSIANHTVKDSHRTKGSDRDRVVHKYSDHLKNEKIGPVVDKDFDNYSKRSMAAITTVAINPNNHQCLWVAFGGQQGLVRLVNIFDILPAKIQIGLQETTSSSKSHK